MAYHSYLSLHDRQIDAQNRVAELEKKQKELTQALSENKKEHDVQQQGLELTARLLQMDKKVLEDIRIQQEEMNAERKRKEASKLAEGESAARSVFAATDAIPEGWFSPQLARTGAEKLSSYGDPGTKFDVRFDERTKIFLTKEVKGVKTYAVRCQTVLGNDVVVLFEGNIIW